MSGCWGIGPGDEPSAGLGCKFNPARCAMACAAMGQGSGGGTTVQRGGTELSESEKSSLLEESDEPKEGRRAIRDGGAPSELESESDWSELGGLGGGKTGELSCSHGNGSAGEAMASDDGSSEGAPVDRSGKSFGKVMTKGSRSAWRALSSGSDQVSSSM